MPIPLRELQGLFWQSIAATPGEPTAAPALLEVIAPSATLDAPARLGVYADAYVLRLHEVLGEDFPRVAALLGPDRFAALVRAYLRGHPSSCPSVRHLGRALEAFLAGWPDGAPWLADLAALEWARVEVFDAADAAALRAADLRQVAPEAWPVLRFAAVPALAIVRAGWPVHELWAGADPAVLAPAATAIRVWRGSDERVYHAPLAPRAADALERLVHGEPFAALCASFDDLPPLEAAHEVTGLLARWLEDGIVASRA